MTPHGWRHLADLLRGLREARWGRLPTEDAAAEVWPLFRDAVMAAAEESFEEYGPRLEEERPAAHDEERPAEPEEPHQA